MSNSEKRGQPGRSKFQFLFLAGVFLIALPGLHADEWVLQTSSSRLEVLEILSLSPAELEVRSGETALVIPLDEIFWIRKQDRKISLMRPLAATTLGMGLGIVVASLPENTGWSSATAVLTAVLSGTVAGGIGFYRYYQHLADATIHFTGMLPEERYARMRTVLELSS